MSEISTLEIDYEVGTDGSERVVQLKLPPALRKFECDVECSSETGDKPVLVLRVGQEDHKALRIPLDDNVTASDLRVKRKKSGLVTVRYTLPAEAQTPQAAASRSNSEGGSVEVTQPAATATSTAPAEAWQPSGDSTAKPRGVLPQEAAASAASNDLEDIDDDASHLVAPAASLDQPALTASSTPTVPSNSATSECIPSTAAAPHAPAYDSDASSSASEGAAQYGRARSSASTDGSSSSDERFADVNSHASSQEAEAAEPSGAPADILASAADSAAEKAGPAASEMPVVASTKSEAGSADTSAQAQVLPAADRAAATVREEVRTVSALQQLPLEQLAARSQAENLTAPPAASPAAAAQSDMAGEAPVTSAHAGPAEESEEGSSDELHPPDETNENAPANAVQPGGGGAKKKKRKKKKKNKPAAAAGGEAAASTSPESTGAAPAEPADQPPDVSQEVNAAGEQLEVSSQSEASAEQQAEQAEEGDQAQHAEQAKEPPARRTSFGAEVERTPLHGPVLRYGVASYDVKKEDKRAEYPCNTWAHAAVEGEAPFAAFGVFDGHGGRQAAVFAAKKLLPNIMAALDRSPEAPQAKSDIEGVSSHDSAVWALQDALIKHWPQACVEGFLQTDEVFARPGPSAKSGTTATVALTTGWELIVANVGDSCAFLDTGTEILQVTANHRLDTNEAEQKRVRAAGAELQPAIEEGKYAGPLRAWPGGLAMSRTIGDVEARAFVIAEPEVHQVSIPASGARLIIGSDGLWDAVQMKEASHVTHGLSAEKAAQRLTAIALKRRLNMDDVTTLVLDFLPSDSHKYPPLLATKGAVDSSLAAAEALVVLQPLADAGGWRERLAARREGVVQELAAQRKAQQDHERSLAEAAKLREADLQAERARLEDAGVLPPEGAQVGAEAEAGPAQAPAGGSPSKSWETVPVKQATQPRQRGHGKGRRRQEIRGQQDRAPQPGGQPPDEDQAGGQPEGEPAPEGEGAAEQGDVGTQAQPKRRANRRQERRRAERAEHAQQAEHAEGGSGGGAGQEQLQQADQGDGGGRGEGSEGRGRGRRRRRERQRHPAGQQQLGREGEPAESQAAEHPGQHGSEQPEGGRRQGRSRGGRRGAQRQAQGGQAHDATAGRQQQPRGRVLEVPRPRQQEQQQPHAEAAAGLAGQAGEDLPAGLGGEQEAAAEAAGRSPTRKRRERAGRGAGQRGQQAQQGQQASPDTQQQQRSSKRARRAREGGSLPAEAQAEYEGDFQGHSEQAQKQAAVARDRKKTRSGRAQREKRERWERQHARQQEEGAAAGAGTAQSAAVHAPEPAAEGSNAATQVRSAAAAFEQAEGQPEAAAVEAVDAARRAADRALRPSGPLAAPMEAPQARQIGRSAAGAPYQAFPPPLQHADQQQTSSGGVAQQGNGTAPAPYGAIGRPQVGAGSAAVGQLAEQQTSRPSQSERWADSPAQEPPGPEAHIGSHAVAMTAMAPGPSTSSYAEHDQHAAPLAAISSTAAPGHTQDPSTPTSTAAPQARHAAARLTAADPVTALSPKRSGSIGREARPVRMPGNPLLHSWEGRGHPQAAGAPAFPSPPAPPMMQMQAPPGGSFQPRPPRALGPRPMPQHAPSLQDIERQMNSGGIYAQSAPPYLQQHPVGASWTPHAPPAAYPAGASHKFGSFSPAKALPEAVNGTASGGQLVFGQMPMPAGPYPEQPYAQQQAQHYQPPPAVRPSPPPHMPPPQLPASLYDHQAEDSYAASHHPLHAQQQQQWQGQSPARYTAQPEPQQPQQTQQMPVPQEATTPVVQQPAWEESAAVPPPSQAPDVKGRPRRNRGGPRRAPPSDPSNAGSTAGQIGAAEVQGEMTSAGAHTEALAGDRGRGRQGRSPGRPGQPGSRVPRAATSAEGAGEAPSMTLAAAHGGVMDQDQGSAAGHGTDARPYGLDHAGASGQGRLGRGGGRGRGRRGTFGGQADGGQRAAGMRLHQQERAGKWD